jgi:hypothetical protein
LGGCQTRPPSKLESPCPAQTSDAAGQTQSKTSDRATKRRLSASADELSAAAAGIRGALSPPEMCAIELAESVSNQKTPSKPEPTVADACRMLCTTQKESVPLTHRGKVVFIFTARNFSVRILFHTSPVFGGTRSLAVFCVDGVRRRCWRSDV